VLLWRERFTQAGVPGLEHEPSRKASSQRLDEAWIKRIVETTLQTTPPAATHWSTRTLGEHLGVSHMTVARVWDSHGLQPHRCVLSSCRGQTVRREAYGHCRPVPEPAR